MQTIKSKNVSWANKDLDHKLQVLFHHLDYLEDQMDIVKTVNLCMANDIPHEDLLECLRKKINAPLTIKQIILDLVKNYTMFGGGDLNHIEMYLNQMHIGLNKEIDDVILAQLNLKKSA